MPGKDYTFPARHSLNISSRLTEDGDYIDLQNLYESATARQDRLEVTGVLLGAAAGTTATVRGVLKDDDNNNVITYTLALGVVHPLMFKRIYSTGTSATTVIVVGQ